MNRARKVLLDQPPPCAPANHTLNTPRLTYRPSHLPHRYLDDGGFPDQYTADCFRAALTDNQASKGKVEAIRHLRDELMTQLQQQLPEEAAEYVQLLEQQGLAEPSNAGTQQQ